MSKSVRLWANVGTMIAALWLVSFLVPEAQEIMLDMLFSFLLGLLVTAALWWTAWQGRAFSRFWRLLAAAWTVALVGSLFWGFYELLTGQSLPYISLVDALYLVRYGLLFVAFLSVLGVPAGRQWLSLLTTLGAATAVGMGLYFFSLPQGRQSFTLYMAGAVYPILDMGLVYLALEARMQPPDDRFRTPLDWLSLALMAYGAANWLNSYGHLINWPVVSGLAALFWPLSDILTGLAVLSWFRRSSDSAPPVA